MIPRVIHQIWVGGPAPAWVHSYRRTWTERHPGWSMRLWTDENLPPMRNRHLYETAGDHVPIENVGQFRSDVARYEILHRVGGVYVDADFECLRPIDNLLGEVDCFAAWEVQDRWVANGIMGSVPGHPFVDRLIDGLPDSVRLLRGQTPNRSTGPRYLTGLHRQRPGELTVLPSWLFFPYLHHELNTAKARPPWPSRCYAVHHWANRRRILGQAMP